MRHQDMLSADQLRALLVRARAEGAHAQVCRRLEWILHFVEHRQSITDTCRFFGISRSTFHRWIERFDPNDLSSLEERSHEPAVVRQADVPANVIELIRTYRMHSPQSGKERIAELLASEHGVTLSVSTVGRIIERECLYFGDTPLHWRKRMAATQQRPVFRTAPAMQPLVDCALQPAPAPAAVHACDTDCPLCRLKSFRWKSLRSAAFVTSIVFNLALASLIVFTAMLEGGQQTSAKATPATILPSEHNETSFLNKLLGIEIANAATGIYRPINYQGKLTNSGGVAIANGNYDMRFRIYGAASGGVPLWSETWSSGTQKVTSTGGLFSIALGTHVAMTGSVNFNSDSLFLQVEFDPGADGTFEEVFSPRRRFASVPYAHNANSLDGLDSTQFIRSDISYTSSGTLTISPRDASKVGIDILSTAGTANVAALKLSTQGANHIVFGTGAANYDTNLYRSAVGTLKTDGNFSALGTLSGKTLVVSGNGSFTGSLVVRKGISGATLEVLGTASGADLYATRSISGTNIYAATTFGGAGLADCDVAGSSKLLWDVSTKRFSCGTDQTGGSAGTASFSGGVLRLADARYVKKQGDTMTGALVINITGGNNNTLGLNVLNTISGAIVRAAKQLTSSGTLLVESGATFDGGTLFVDAVNNRAGVNTVAPGTTLDVIQPSATTSLAHFGPAVNSGGFITASNLVMSLSAGASYLAGNWVHRAPGGNGNAILDIGNGAFQFYTNNSLGYGDTFTPTERMRLTNAGLGIGTQNPKSALDVFGNISGRTMTISGNGAFTGSLVVKNSISGATLEILGTASGANLYATRSITGTNIYAATTFGGAGLASCSNSTTSKLLYNSATKQFSCGTDQTGGSAGTASFSGAVLSLGDARYVKKQGDTMTGALTINITGGNRNTLGLKVLNTISGAIIHAENLLTSSGGEIIVGRDVNKAVSVIRDAVSQIGNLQEWQASNGSVLAYINPNGTASFQSIYNLSTYAITKLGTDGSYVMIGNSNTPKAQLDVAGTISGKTLVISGNGSFSGSLVVAKGISGTTLEILGTASGQNLFATRSISGTYLYAATTFGGAGLASCSNSTTSKLLYNSATKQFSCGTDQTGGSAGTASFSGAVLTLADARYVKKQGDTMTGALTINITGGNRNTLGLKVLNTISGSVIRAQNTLASSGSLIVKKYAGTSTGNTLVVDTQGLVYDASNKRVGIGTASPTSELQILTTRYDDLSSFTMFTSDGPTWAGTATTGSMRINPAASTGLGELVFLNTAGTVIEAMTNTGAKTYGRLAFSAAGTALTTPKFGVGTTTPGSKLSVSGAVIIGNNLGSAAADANVALEAVGTISGKTLTISGNGSFTGSLVVNRSISGATLEILGTASGQNLFATRSISGTYLYAATTFGGAGLASCSNATTSKLLYNSATKQFACGTDNTGGSAGTASFSGSVLILGDARYVKKQGDTMTGALTISLTSGTVGLRVLGAMSGNTLTVSKGLHAAGSGVVISSTGQTVFNALNRNVDFTIRGVTENNLFRVDASANAVGIGTAAPKATLDIVGTLSGRNLIISNHAAFSGAVLIGNNSTDVVTFKSVISGSLIPAITNTYSLGSDTLRWKNFYLSGAISLGVSGDAASIQYDTVGDRIKFDADSDGNIDFRMADIGSFDILEASANAPTASNYARIFARPSSSGGNDSDTTYLVNAEDSSGIATNTAQGKTNTNSHGGSCIYNSATQAKFGSNSISLNCASTYQYYRFSSTNDDYFVTGDFTIDAWVYEDANTGVNRVLMAQTAFNDHQWMLALTSGNKLQGTWKTSTGMTISITDTVNFPTAQWVHVAFERSGNTFRVYKNGTSIGSITSSASLKAITSRYLMLGNRYPYNFAGDQLFTGYMDEIRISKVARYSGNFTAPSSAYAGDTGGLFVRLSNGRLIALTGSGAGSGGGGGGDSVWTVNNDNSIYYSIGQVGVGTVTPLGQMEVQQDDYFGSGALLVDQNVTTGTGIYVDSAATGAPGIAISMPGNATSLNPHLLFGYADIFDTNLYRPGFATLRTDGSLQVGNALTVTGTTTLNGNTVIGSDSSDTVTFNAYVNSSILPATDNTYDLGSSALRWRDLYVGGSSLHIGSNGNDATIGYDTSSNYLTFNPDAAGNPEVVMLDSGWVGIGTTDPKATLDVLGTASGTYIYASRSVSGADIFAAKSISGTYLYAASTFGGAGLGSCSNATTSKLLYNSATKQFSCGTDQTGGTGVSGTSSFSGAVLRLGDARYVKKQGDTMTGALTINLTSGSLGLKIIQTASGNIIHAEKTLTSSGIILAVGSITTRNTLSGKTLVVSGNASVTGSLVVAKSISGATLEILGTASGKNLYATQAMTGTNIYAATTFGGAGLASCSNSTTSKLLYNSATKQFSCGTDQNAALEVGTSSFSGATLRLADARYVKKQGDTMTGALTIDLTSGYLGLKIIETASGNIIHAEKDLTSSGTLKVVNTARFSSGAIFDTNTFYVDANANRVGVGTTTPKATLDVVGTISGKTLTVSGNGSFSGSLVVNKNISGATLEILGTASGADLFATRSISGTNIYAATTFGGAGLADCDTAGSSKLLWSIETKRFSCGTDQSGSSGISMSIADERYVRKAGDTMTGALTIDLTSGYLGLKIIETASGNIIHAEKTLTSSGIILAVGSITTRNTLSGKTLVVSGNASVTGSLVVNRSISGATLEILGTASGQNLFATRSITGANIYAATTFGGAGLASCSNSTTSKLLYNSATKQFSCGTDQTGGTGVAGTSSFSGAVLTIGDARYVKKQGDTMTGALVINITGGNANTIGLKVYNTISGAVLHAASQLRSSGSLLVESGATFDTTTMYIDAMHDRVGIGTTGPKALLDVAGTISGKTLVISGNGAFSGSLVVAKSISGATLEILGTASGKNLYATQAMTGTNIYAATTFGGAGLASCSNSTTSKLLYNSATKQFSCGTDQNAALEVGTSSFSGATLRLADARYVRKAGDTMTGALTIDLTSGYLGLKIVETASGNIIHAEKTLTSSGIILAVGSITTRNTLSGKTLVVSGNASITGSLVVNRSISGATIEILGTASGQNLFATRSISGTYLYAATTFGGAGLVDCDTAGTSKLLWDAATKRFSCGTDQSGSSGISLSIADERYVKKQGDTMTGTLIITNNGTIAIGGVSAQAYNILSDSTTATHGGDIASDNDLFIEGAFEVDGPAYLDNGLTVSSTASFNSGITVSSAATFNSVIAVGGISAQSYNAFSDSGGASHTGDLASDDDVFVAGSMEVDGNVYFDGELIGTTVSGMGLTSCTGSSNKLTYNSSTKQFGCETDQTGGSGFAYFTIYDGSSSSQIDSTDTLTFNDGTDINLSVSGDSVTASFTNASGYINSGTADGNYVNVSGGDSMNGTLVINSGTLQLSSGSFNSCTALETDSSGNITCGTDDSGSNYWTDGGTYLYPSSGESINIGTSGYSYNIFGSASTTHSLIGVSDVLIANSLEVDGNVYFDGELIGTTMTGFGLSDCDGTYSKLIYDSTSKQFSCSTDQAGGGGSPPEVGTNSFSGAVLLLGDARYVKKQGDTMTGALTINLTSGSLGLKIIQTASGNIIHAEKTLTSSGIILAVGSITTRNTLSGKTLVVSGNASVTGSLVVNKNISGATLEILGTASGKNLYATQAMTGTNIYAATTFGGAGLASCSNSTTSKLLYNSATKQFACGTDQNSVEVGSSSFSGAVLRLGDARYVKKQGDTMTGALVINITGGNNNTLGLKVLNTFSGAIIHAEKTLTASGMLITESGALIDAGTLYVDAGNNRVGIGTIAPTAILSVASPGGAVTMNNPTAGNGVILAGSGGGVGGQLRIVSNGGGWADNKPTAYFQMRTARADNTLYNNNVTFMGGTYGADTVMDRLQFDSSFTTVTDTAYGSTPVPTSLFELVNSTAGKNVLKLKGAASQTANLTEWQNSAGTVLASIDKTGSGFLANLGIGTNSPKTKLDVVGTISGKTLVISGNGSFSGALVVKKSISGATLEILGTASGADIFATRSVTGTNIYAATTFGGAGLASCSNATTSKLLYNSATKQFSCGTDQTGGGSAAPEVGTLSFSGAVLRLGDARYVKKQGDTMTGQLVINLTAGSIGLNVLAGMSGNTLTVAKGASLAGSGITITSSGQTVFNRLNRNVDFSIRGSSDSNLVYVDASSNAVGIGTLLPKAKLDILGTLSGKTLTISGNGSFSGSLVVKKSISGASLEVLGTISGVTVVASGTGTRPLIFASAPWSGVGIGSNTPTQRLTVSGGTILNVAGGTVRTLSGVNLGTQMNDMVVVGRYAYVAGGNSPNFRIVDISNPLNPRTVSSLHFGYAAQSIVVAGKYAYVGTTTTTNENLRIIDISNPFVPVQVATTSVAGGMVGVQAMAINGKTLYMGKGVDFSTAEFVIADISNPLAPKMLSSIDFGSSVGINSIVIQGKYAYVGSDDDFSSGNEFRVIDISSPNNPIDKGGLSLSTGVKSISVAGPYAYVGLGTVTGNDFRIFDISNPSSISTVGGLDLSTDVLSVDIAGRYAYLGLTSATGNDFRVVNISNPASPSSVGGADPANTVRKVVVAGKYAYAGFADTVGADMIIYDINGIDAPSASIGSMGVEVLYVGRSATVAQSLNVIGSLNVGIGGIKSDGMLAISVGSGATISGMTGAIIQNRGFSGTVLALDSWRGNGTGSQKIVPHLLFGYRGSFDTMLYRAGTGVLANSGTLLLRGGTGRTLLKIETQMNSSVGANIIEVFSNASTGFGAANHNRIARMDGYGSMYSDGSFNGGGADYAERFLASTPNLKPGQAVCLDPLHSNTVKLCDRSGDPNVMGIISTKPAFVGDKYRGGEADGKSDSTSAIVGLIGQLPAKAIVEDGQAISVGDALATAAKAGFVRKAKAGESTVGVALSPLASGEGSIDVLITRRNQSDLVEKIENEVTQSIADMHIEDDVRTMVQSAMNGANINGAVSAAVQAQVQSLNLAAEINAILNQRLADGSLNIGSSGTLSTDIFAALQTQTGAQAVQNAVSAHLGLSRTGTSALMLGSDLLVAGAVTVQQDVMIGGTLHAAAIQGPIRFDGPILPGTDFAIGAIRMTGSTVTIGSITESGALEVMGNVTISGLATFLGQVEVRGELIVSSNQAGFAVIPAHTKAVAVRFGTGFVSTPVINATPNGRVGSEWWIDSQTQTGFVIRADKSVTQDVRFSWTALGVRNAGTSTGQAGAVSLIPFHTDAQGRPYSTVDNVWNACIRDPNSLDACRGYHQGSQWFFHPDIVAANQEVLSFTYDAAAGPSSLVIPSSYETQVIEQETSSSSSSVSSEASSSSSSVSSEASSSSSIASSESSSSSASETGTGGAVGSSESSSSSASSEAVSSSAESSDSSSSSSVGEVQ